VARLLCSEGPPLFTLRVSDVAKLKKDNLVSDAVQVMSERRIGSVVIVDDEDKPIGIFTERDLLIKVLGEGRPLNLKLEEVMTPKPIVAKNDWPAAKALETMIANGFRHLPIVDDSGRLIGIVSIKDIGRIFMQEIDVSELYAAG